MHLNFDTPEGAEAAAQCLRERLRDVEDADVEVAEVFVDTPAGRVVGYRVAWTPGRYKDMVEAKRAGGYGREELRK